MRKELTVIFLLSGAFGFQCGSQDFSLMPNTGSAVSLSPEDQAFQAAFERAQKLPVEQRPDELVRLARLFKVTLKQQILSNREAGIKLSPPKELISHGKGWRPFSESEPTIQELYAAQQNEGVKAERLMWVWALLFKEAPSRAFQEMRRRVAVKGSTNVDALSLLAATSRTPGAPLTSRISKDVWKEFHSSNNPICRIIALEKFDSTDQTPAELLTLYRECLMDSFGYLQVRALEGIYRSKDFRPEVAALLKEYLNSNPVLDDGTLPAFPAIIGNPVDGAKMILAEISKVGSAVNATPSKSLPPTASSAVTRLPSAQLPATKKSPEAKPAVSLPSEQPASPTPWSIIVVSILVATCLLWLLVKKRK